MKERFSLRRPKKLGERIAAQAALVFDSFRQPMLAGMRASAGVPARQLLYKAGRYTIKLQVEPGAGEERLCDRRADPGRAGARGSAARHRRARAQGQPDAGAGRVTNRWGSSTWSRTPRASSSSPSTSPRSAPSPSSRRGGRRRRGGRGAERRPGNRSQQKGAAAVSAAGRRDRKASQHEGTIGRGLAWPRCWPAGPRRRRPRRRDGPSCGSRPAWSAGTVIQADLHARSTASRRCRWTALPGETAAELAFPRAQPPAASLLVNYPLGIARRRGRSPRALASTSPGGRTRPPPPCSTSSGIALPAATTARRRGSPTSTQPAADIVRVREAHCGSRRTGSVTVAVIDTGVDPQPPHPGSRC